ncbi:lactonase family protein [Actinacidiphila acidipaludis]|uniref:Lactonase family protein n=1 Tax=Actinacidiphila acidipaludis TaxID=2873382 RepID=A0ABS7QHC6_9ACTN|nr:lactonase family protein [Streptomyces acidipaludis]MBY8882577.1 lactonase family protein [Streptomyces acidipaludis]
MTSTALRTASLLTAALACATVFAGPAGAYSPSSGSMVFVQTDNPQGNTIVAYHQTTGGSLHQAGTYTTGGLGGQIPGTGPDNLASQGALTYDQAHHLLYAVNAGSNTITVFSVDGDRLIRRQILPSAGSFPVSVAVHGNHVYVLNSGDGGSVQGYLNVGGLLVKVPSWHRGLDLASGTTPGQVGITPDGGKLVVTTKSGDSIDVFPIGPLGPAGGPVVTRTPGQGPFGFTFDAAGRLIVTESATNSVATFTIGRDAQLTKVSEVATGQTATCWVIGTGDHFYASNAASASLTGLSENAHGSLTSIGDTTTAAGTVDAAVTSDGKFLHVQTGVAGGVDSFRVDSDGSLTKTGTVTVPDAAGGEGIVAL